jgi:hypothetical protein
MALHHTQSNHIETYPQPHITNASPKLIPLPSCSRTRESLVPCTTNARHFRQPLSNSIRLSPKHPLATAISARPSHVTTIEEFRRKNQLSLQRRSSRYRPTPFFVSLRVFCGHSSSCLPKAQKPPSRDTSCLAPLSSRSRVSLSRARSQKEFPQSSPKNQLSLRHRSIRHRPTPFFVSFRVFCGHSSPSLSNRSNPAFA